MAVFNSFTFDEINSLSHGIYVTGEAVFNAPERMVEMIPIPGKNGALAIDQGYFSNIEVTYPAGCFADSMRDFADKIAEFRNILTSRYSYVRLIDTYHPDEFRLALYKSGLEVSPVRYNSAAQFNITFECKPQRWLNSGATARFPTEYRDLQTRTGGVVTIDNSEGGYGVKSLKVALEPIQDLHGYDNPWVGGAGKNLVPPLSTETKKGITLTSDNGKYTLNGTATAITDFNIDFPTPLEAGEYIVQLWNEATNNNINVYILTSSGTNNPSVNTRVANANYTFTRSETLARMRIRVANGATLSNFKLSPTIAKGSTLLSAFEPYENICPISGRDSVDVVRTGVNLWDEEWEVGSYNSETGAKVSNTSRIRSTNKIPCIGGATYYFRVGVNSTYGVMCYYDDDENFISSYSYTGNATFTPPTNARYCAWTIVNYGTTYNHDICINYPSTDHAYHAYQGESYTTDLGRTVYGGTLNLISGVLTVDKEILTFDSNNANLWSGVATSGQGVTRVYTAQSYANRSVVCSDSYEVATDYNTTIGIVTIPSSGRLIVTPPFAQGKTLAEFQTALADHPFSVVLTLATPQTYQLTPEQISLLTGDNNIWSDAGEVEVTFGINPYYNPTPFDAKPLIKVTGAGTLTVGDKTITILPGTSTLQTIYIDCETMEAWENLDGGGMIARNDYIQDVDDGFPTLKPGNNTVIAGSGIHFVQITPRWWKI